MPRRNNRDWWLPIHGIKILFITLILLGGFFRLTNLDRKVYWFDETFTSLRVSGYTETELVNRVCDGRLISSEDLQKYQHLNPQRTLGDTIKSLASEDPQHPPFYYLMMRFWVQWFGDSVTTIRSLSAIISLLAFPCIYWLCLELFNSATTGWIAIGLIAVSPFHILYAQEARQYSLWTVTILLSSAVLLRAMRLKTKLSWAMYAITVALGLYTFLFSILVTISHSIYVFAREKFRFSKIVVANLLATGAGILLFTPWILAIASNTSQLNKTTAWTALRISRLSLAKIWSLNLSYFFFNFNRSSNSIEQLNWVAPLSLLLRGIILVLVGCSIYFICCHASKKVLLFLLILIGVTALPLMLPDIISESQRSKTARYLIPAYIGIQLTVAYFLAFKLTAVRVANWRRKFWQLTTFFIFSLGILSCAIDAQAQTSWHKDLNLYTPKIAEVLNRYPQPILISFCEDYWALGDELPLSYLLDSKVKLQLFKEQKTIHINPGFKNIFILNSSQKDITQFQQEQKYKLEAIQPQNLNLWQLIKI